MLEEHKKFQSTEVPSPMCTFHVLVAIGIGKYIISNWICNYILDLLPDLLLQATKLFQWMQQCVSFIKITLFRLLPVIEHTMTFDIMICILDAFLFTFFSYKERYGWLYYLKNWDNTRGGPHGQLGVLPTPINQKKSCTSLSRRNQTSVGKKPQRRRKTPTKAMWDILEEEVLPVPIA